jgi:rhamnulokinase
VVGGGCQNELLCQFAADATGLPVIAGPVEATAIGNLLVQALALGQLGSLSELRAIVRQSFPLKQFLPQQVEPWETAYERFEGIKLFKG